MQVCGPQPYKYNGGNSFNMVQVGPDPAHTFGEGEWQCVELAMRFMALVYGVTPYGANGDGVVDNYRADERRRSRPVQQRHARHRAATGRRALVHRRRCGPGHVGIVASSAVDGNGNGSITMLSQNDTDDGWRTLPVTNWNVGGFTHHSARNWLHDPAGRGWGAANSTTGAWGGVTARPGGGYWAVTPFGKVAGGGAPVFGDASTFRLNAPIVDMAATPSGKGYWLVGGRRRHLQLRRRRRSTAAPAASSSTSPSSAWPRRRAGKGYWLVASDGGIFSFGDAAFHGSTGGIPSTNPSSAWPRHPPAHGYWLVASDGGIFSFGDAAFHGCTGSINLNQPIVGMAATPQRPRLLARRVRRRHLQLRRRRVPRQHGHRRSRPPDRRHGAHDRTAAGYWLVETDGVTVHTFGNGCAVH